MSDSFEVKIASSGQIVVVPWDKSVVRSRGRHSHLLRPGRLRHLPDACAGRRTGTLGQLSHARGAGRQRPVHALLLTVKQCTVGAGPVDTPIPAGRVLHRSLEPSSGASVAWHSHFLAIFPGLLHMRFT